MPRIKALLFAATTATFIFFTAPVALSQPASMPAPSMAKPAPMAPVMAPAVMVATMAPMAAPKPMSAPAAAMQPSMAPEPMSMVAAPTAAPAKAKGNGWEKADNLIKLIVAIILGLTTVVGSIVTFVKGVGWRQKLKTERVLKWRGYLLQAFPTVEALAKGTGWEGDDKLVELVKRMDQWLFEDGEKPLSVEEVKAVAKEAADLAAKAKVDDDRAKDVKPETVTRKDAPTAATVASLSDDLG